MLYGFGGIDVGDDKMIKRYLTNLLLIGLIIGLYWFNTTDNSAVDQAPQLSNVVSSEIHNITISRPDIADIVLEKSTSGWKITQPIQAIANNTRVELLLSFLNTPSYAQIKVDSNNALVQFELEPADIVLTLDTLKVKFGGIEPISNHRYVLIDNVVHLITDRITPLLRANAASFIENKLIPQSKIITKLVLPQLNADSSFSAEPAITIENNNGHWQSNMPSLTSNQLTELVENWQHAYAMQVQLLKPAQLPKEVSPMISTNSKVHVWFKDQVVPTEYTLKLNDNGLFIIDTQQKLDYQFTLAALAQLLPPATTKQ